jgi:hypothetical protein
MGLFRKQPKPQQFRYIPRYWDPAREEREARINEARAAADGDTEVIKARISRSFRQPYRGTSRQRHGSTMRSTLITMAAVIFLFWIAYMLLTRYMPAIEAWMNQ